MYLFEVIHFDMKVIGADRDRSKFAGVIAAWSFG